MTESITPYAPAPQSMVSLMVSIKVLQAVGEVEDRPTFCSIGNPADDANRPVLLRF